MTVTLAKRTTGCMSAHRVVNALRHRHTFGWAGALAELIDNAFGNGATRVSIIFDAKQLTVRDNGNGCSYDMFIAMVTPYSHEEDPDALNPISMYGTGGTEAALWIGGPTRYCHPGQGRPMGWVADPHAGCKPGQCPRP